MIYAVALPKGGVGKSETALQLGLYLAKNGERTLLIDSDPQGDLTARVHGVVTSDSDFSKVLGGAARPTLTLWKAAQPLDLCGGLFLVPASIDLANIEAGLAQRRVGRFTALANALSQSNGFENIIIDCPTTIGYLVMNALVAANRIMIPTLAEPASVRHIADLSQILAELASEHPVGIISGVIATMVRCNTKRHQAGIALLRGDMSKYKLLDQNGDFDEITGAFPAFLGYVPAFAGVDAAEKIQNAYEQIFSQFLGWRGK